MQDIEKLVEAAIDYRLVALKAREVGIISISSIGTERESFQFYDEKDFARMIKDKEYTIKNFDSTDYKYKYTSTISGLKFFCITTELLFEGDEKKIEEEE